MQKQALGRGGVPYVGLQVFLGDLLGFGLTTLLFLRYGLDGSLIALGLIFPLFFVPRPYRAFSTSAILVLLGMQVVLFAQLLL